MSAQDNLDIVNDKGEVIVEISMGPVFPGEKGEKGDKGDKGDPGPQGLKGDKGDTGPKGAQGDAGPKGDTGAKGERGEKGDQGLKGDRGEQGFTGPKGDHGDPGPAGPGNVLTVGTVIKGDVADVTITGDSPKQVVNFVLPKGDQGLPGPKGDTGPKGDKGDTGNTGAKGDQGPKGDKGDVGPSGPRGDVGPTGPAGPIGPKGDTGVRGSLIFTADRDPTDFFDKGNPGDMWLNSSETMPHGGNVYTLQAEPAGKWLKTGNIKGVKGDFGVGINMKGAWVKQTPYAVHDGVQFEGSTYHVYVATTINDWKSPPVDTAHYQLVVKKGDTGSKGDQGVQGPRGDQGLQGPIGKDGPKGDKGDTGAAARIMGAFGAIRKPEDLPLHGLIPKDWDGPGYPKEDTQLYDGDALLYSRAKESDPLYQHLFSYIVDFNDDNMNWWLDAGKISGPKGDKGDKGDQGIQGIQGVPGPNNVLTVGTVVKGDEAKVTISGDSPSQVISFVLPKGDKGDKGDPANYQPWVYTDSNYTVKASDITGGVYASSAVNFNVPNDVAVAMPAGAYIDFLNTGDHANSYVSGNQITIYTTNGGTYLQGKNAHARLTKISGTNFLLAGMVGLRGGAPFFSWPGSYTVKPVDNRRGVIVTGSGGGQIDVPNTLWDAAPDGFYFHVHNQTDGALTITGSGTIQSKAGRYLLKGGFCTIVKASVNNWFCSGQMSTTG